MPPPPPDRPAGRAAAPDGVPAWIEPMAAALARPGETPSGDWVYERKLDGVRVLAYVDVSGVRLLSRNRIRQEDAYPEVADAFAEACPLDAVVDGEVVAFDEEGATRFDLLQQRMGVHDEARSRANPVRVTFVAFDLLWLAGQDLRDLPLRDRLTLLHSAVDPVDGLLLSEPLVGDPADLLDTACAEGWEGLIAKRAASRYQGRRSRDWLKLKCAAAQEMVVVGFTEPQGSRVGLGALLLGYHEDGRLRYGGKVGTGFSHAVLRSLRSTLDGLEVDSSPLVDPPREKGAHWVRPELVAQVEFGEWTRDGRLRHPRYLGLRDDKDPADVVRESPPSPRDPHDRRTGA